MTALYLRRAFGATLAIALGLAIALPAMRSTAQDDGGKQPGERKVEPQKLPLDRTDVWTLHFRYKPPRITTVDGFDAKGNPAKQVVWMLQDWIHLGDATSAQFLDEPGYPEVPGATNH